MKVLMVTEYWRNSAGGGIKNYQIDLVNEHKQRGKVDVGVIFLEGEDPDQYKVKANKFTFPIKAFLMLLKLKPDIVHTQSCWYCLLPGYLYKRLSGAKLIHTFYTEPFKKLPLYGKMFMQTQIDRCDCVTFVSSDLKSKIEELQGLKFKNTEITYAGVKQRKASEEDKREFLDKFGIKENSIILLGLNLTALKYKADGAKLLIKAINKLKDKYPGLILVLTREGSCSNELKEFAVKEGVYDRVIFTGSIEDKYIPAVLELCDIYTHITVGEGFGLSILEAMLMEKPVIATKVGAQPEYVQDGKTGLMVDKDVDDIAEKIECLIKDKELAKALGMNGAQRVREEFRWDTTLDKFVKIFGADVS